MFSAIDVIARIKEAYSLESDAEVSRFLGVSTANLSNWKSRDTLNFDVVLTKCEGCDLNWLLTGEERPSTQSIPTVQLSIPQANSQNQQVSDNSGELAALKSQVSAAFAREQAALGREQALMDMLKQSQEQIKRLQDQCAIQSEALTAIAMGKSAGLASGRVPIQSDHIKV